LSVFSGYLLMVAGDLDAVGPRLDDAERALAAVPDGSAVRWADTEELRTLPATIAVYRASLAQARGDVAGTSQHARHALDLAGPGDHLARGSAAGFLGLAAWAQGDVSTALATFTQAVASLHAAGNLVDELSGTVVLADLWLVAGRPSKARRLSERALRLAETHGEPVALATADLHVGLSEIDLEAGDLEAAHRHLEIAAGFVGRTSMTESRFRWFVAMGRVAEVAGDPQEAINLLDKAEQLYRPGFFPDVRPIAAMKARVWISRGNLSQAVDWAHERGVSATDDVSTDASRPDDSSPDDSSPDDSSLDDSSPDASSLDDSSPDASNLDDSSLDDSSLDDSNYLREFDHLTFVRLLIAQYRVHRDTGALDQAGRLLDRLREPAETSGRAGSLLEIRILQALVHDAQGDRTQALESLAQALTQAPEPGCYVRLFLDEGAPMLGLLREATHHDVAGEHARRLLNVVASAEAEAPDAGQRPAPLSAESLSERELQVLKLLDSELSGPQIARELFVSHNTLRTHTKHIFTKLDVTSRRAAVLRARERGLM
ncbi:MAG TPA: LuxR C-terminal-related transcriptional regulator, partial [Dermatophilaceae bacterium]